MATADELAAFRVGFPEFQDADDDLVQSALDDAALMTPAEVWGDKQDLGTRLRAAQALALSPYGRNLAFSTKDGSTVYDERLRKLIATVSIGARVI